MEASLATILKKRRGEIRRRWEFLLRRMDHRNPLSDPDVTVRLIDWTLDRVLDELRRERSQREPPAYAAVRNSCRCGHNPLPAFFLAGEEALMEVVAGAIRSGELPAEKLPLAEAYFAIHHVARREVQSFCAFCQHRSPPAPPHPAEAAEIPVN